MSGLTTWWAKDSAWWRRERVVELGLEFGAPGPAVLDWLTCEADAQRDGGRVMAGYRTIAHGAFVPDVQVRPIVSACVRLGLLDEFVSVDGGDGAAAERFTCRISGWKRDQDRIHDRMRKRAQRAAQGEESPQTPGNPPPDTPGPGRTRPGVSGDVRAVPGSHVNPTPPLNDNPPSPPKGGRRRDQVAYEDELRSWARGLLPHLGDANDAYWPVKEALSMLSHRKPLRPATRDDVLAYLHEHHPDVVAPRAVA